jgi:anti-anti-sigma factor
MEIKGENYSVSYDQQTTTIKFDGSLRLNGMDEYQQIVNLLNTVLNTNPDQIILNLKDLKFLNSSGINILSKFTIKVRQKKTVQMVLKGSTGIPWQGKSLKNLQRLLPTLQIDIE